MEQTITLTIPSSWLEGLAADRDELRRALRLGLAQLHRRQKHTDATERIVQVLLDTGRVRHLSVALADETLHPERQTPPGLPGPSVSEILISQRKREL